MEAGWWGWLFSAGAMPDRQKDGERGWEGLFLLLLPASECVPSGPAV